MSDLDILRADFESKVGVKSPHLLPFSESICQVALQFRVIQAALDFALDLACLGCQESGWGKYLDIDLSGDKTARVGHWLHMPNVLVVQQLPAGWHYPKDKNGLALPGPYAIPNDSIGYGRGYMQIDFFDDFIKELLPDGTPAWKDCYRNVKRAASIYNNNLNYYHGDKIKAMAAYNCGPRLADLGTKDFNDPQHYTTTGQYATRCMNFRNQWL